MTWLNIGEIINVNANKYPDKLALKDARRQLTFKQLNERSNKLANGILKSGIKKGDKLAVLSNNCIEFMEIYVAAAKGGFIIVPLNFRLHPDEISFVINNSDAKWLFVESRFYEATEKIWQRAKELGFENVERILIADQPAEGWKYFEDIVKIGENTHPSVKVNPEDTWVILYTSGTTGRPKGVVRSHRSYIAFFLINEAEFSFRPQDYGMILMPLSHVNSTFYSFVFTYLGSSVYIHIEYKFDPEEVLRIIDQEKITFTSMIPTHYNLILSLPEEVKQKYDLSHVRALLTSSAPATKQMKLEVMQLFKKTKLFEAYGSTEAGLVTLLRPEDQMNKLGSIGKECIGTDCIKLLDEEGNSVSVGEIGELYSRGPQMFDEYYKLPEKTKDSFKGEFFSAGDMGKKDEEGFYTLVDRKANMIISGGEHVYTSEVEKVIVTHPSV
ncbi:MAG: AMP-binding protein, partial [Promethearchaeia archaeon]